MNYKKLSVRIILSVAILFLIPPPSFAAITDGLIGHWKYDNCDANDGSGNGRNGTLNGNPRCIDGWSGKAYKFDGIDDYIEVSNLNLTTGSSFTTSFWMNFEYKGGRIWVLYFGYNDLMPCSTSSVGGFNMLINTRYNVLQWHNPTESSGQLNSGDTQFGFFCGLDSGLQNRTNISSLSGRWAHITTTYDAGSNVIKSFVNGHLVNTSTGTLIPKLENYPLYIGKVSPQASGQSDTNFQGVLDELRIYNRALADSEVKDLYDSEAALNNYTIIVPDTGQGTCYDGDGNIIPCPQPNTSLAQDGSYNNNPLSYQDNGDGTVTDLNTNLMWQKEDDGVGRIWWGAFDYCNGLQLGGHSDWRLPTVSELVSIVDYGKTSPEPSIDPVFSNTKADPYLVSNVSHFTPDYTHPMLIGFNGGGIGWGHQYRGFYVRCVRGKQYIPLNFTDSGDGTVTDNKTGLMWQKSEANNITWGNAINNCENLRLPDNENGYTDWRLPNIKELLSLSDFMRYYSPPELHPLSMSTTYWSSSTYLSNPVDAWSSYFGGYNVYPKWTNYYDYHSMNARCVRDAIIEPPSPGILEVSPSSYDFGDMFIGDCNLKLFTLKNIGNTDLSIPIISLSDTVNFYFDSSIIYSCSQNGQIIKPKEFCNLVVKSCPTRTGNIKSQFSVTSNDTNYPTTNIPLRVTGKTLVTIGKFTPFGTIYQEINPMKLIGAKEIILAYTNNTTSTKNLNNMQAYLARLNLHPIYQEADICVKGSSIDWEKVHVFINNVDWTDKAIFKRYSSSPNCDSAGAVALNSYWLNATVTPKIYVRTIDGSVGTGEWTFYVNTNYLWPAGKDIAKGMVINAYRLELVVQVIEGLMVPLPAQ